MLKACSTVTRLLAQGWEQDHSHTVTAALASTSPAPALSTSAHALQQGAPSSWAETWLEP